MTDDELKAIEQRMLAASPDLAEASMGGERGPEGLLSASVLYCNDDENAPVYEFRTHDLPSPTAEADAILFAHAKRDIFHLCAEVRRLRHSCSWPGKRIAELRVEAEFGETSKPTIRVRDEMIEQDSLLSSDVKDNK